MNIPGIDEGVKQALIKRTTFQTLSNNNNNSTNLRKRHTSSATASLLSLRKEPPIQQKKPHADESDGLGMKSSTGEYLLGIPSASSQV